MTETKPDKRPIGTDFDTRFSGYKSHQIDVKPGSTIYLGSDGYADQFG
ncbi:serine/threonine-protein phosphatase [Patescibacteria group bacterium]|nr:serine/threonine-protein phosphatase [Patescibacteria group bacterium]MBU1757920.1 serine/threonine-protein phosphatase [Patescibacteria group bacterium]